MWAAIGNIVAAVLIALLNHFIKEGSEPDEAIDADRQPGLAERLRERVRAYKDSLDSPG